MNKLKHRFTQWYIRKGYTFGYDYTGVPAIDDEYIKHPSKIPKAIWRCPFLVRPLLAMFSPSIYAAEAWGKVIVEGLIKGMSDAGK